MLMEGMEEEWIAEEYFEEEYFNAEKYTGFFVFLSAYFSKYLKNKVKETIDGWPDGLDYVIKVTSGTLEELKVDIPWNEFMSLMVELEEDLKFGMPDKTLLKVTIQDYELKIELEADVFRYMAEYLSLDETGEEAAYETGQDHR